MEAAYLRNSKIILVVDVNVDYLDRKVSSKHRLLKSLKNMNMTQYVTVVGRPKSNSCLSILLLTYLYQVLDSPIISQFLFVISTLS